MPGPQAAAPGDDRRENDSRDRENFARAFASHQAGDLAAAEAGYRAILVGNPTHADSLHLLGVLAGQCGRAETAVELIAKATALRPREAVFHGNLTRAWQRLQRVEEAETAWRAAIKAAPREADYAEGLGMLLLRDERPREAAWALRRALHLRPDDAGLRTALGGACAALGQADEAERQLEAAARLAPERALTWENLGRVRRVQDRMAAAGEAFERALALDPHDPEVRYRAGLHRLYRGDLAGGWPLFEARDAAESGAAWCRRLPQPRWRGEPLAGKRLLLWGEQGVGDEVMFAGLLGQVLAEARDGRVLIECDPRLQPLYRRSYPDVETLPRCDPPDPRLHDPAIDLQAPIGDLARWRRPDFAAFAPATGYLAADPERTAALRARYHDGRPLVGLSWRSGNRRNAANRMPPLKAWRPLLRQSGVRFVSLQYGPVAEDAAHLAKLSGTPLLVDPEVDALADLDALAAQTAAMDLVISIDNSTVHLAGALGVPVWLLLAAGPNWRWFEDFPDGSPWYASARLFRQARTGDWGPVFAAAAEVLGDLPETG